jgi:hypothetical protein
MDLEQSETTALLQRRICILAGSLRSWRLSGKLGFQNCFHKPLPYQLPYFISHTPLKVSCRQSDFNSPSTKQSGRGLFMHNLPHHHDSTLHFPARRSTNQKRELLCHTPVGPGGRPKPSGLGARLELLGWACRAQMLDGSCWVCWVWVRGEGRGVS